MAYCECSPDIETCFNLFAEAGIADRWQEYMRGIVVDLVGPMATLSASLRTGISTETSSRRLTRRRWSKKILESSPGRLPERSPGG